MHARLLLSIHLSHLQVLLRIFSFLSHREILKYAVVCKKWHLISQDSRLWGFVSLRPEISGLRVEREDHMLQLISTKFGNNLRYLELNAELVTPNVLVDLAKKCANLTHLLLDFAQASQLHDFTDLGAFPTKLKFLTLYLSDTIFLDNFMKRIYRYKYIFPHLESLCMVQIGISPTLNQLSVFIINSLALNFCLKDQQNKTSVRPRKSEPKFNSIL